MDSQTETELKELLHQSSRQLSEIIFLDDEAHIARDLLAESAAAMQDCHMDKVGHMISQLTLLNMVKANVAKDILIHKEHLKSHAVGLLTMSIDFLKIEDGRIEKELQDLNKCFKNIKKEIVAFTSAPC